MVSDSTIFTREGGVPSPGLPSGPGWLLGPWRGSWEPGEAVKPALPLKSNTIQMNRLPQGKKARIVTSYEAVDAVNGSREACAADGARAWFTTTTPGHFTVIFPFRHIPGATYCL